MIAGVRVAVAALVLTVAAGVTAGCGAFSGGDGTAAGAAPVPVETPASGERAEDLPDATEPAAEPTTEPATAAPSPSRTSRKPKPKGPKSRAPKSTRATPVEDPNNFQEPDCADHEGKVLSKSKARAALVAAAGRTYWPTSAPSIRIPGDLVKSVAWHESGWQTDIVNCDGGRGLMQVMPDTEAFINQRFEQSYDSHDYRQNAVLGANYLAWLTKAFGDDYFGGKYDLSPARCTSHSSRCLLNMVIAGYNAGRGSVDAAYADKRLPNPEYVDSVRSLMKSCYCDRY